MTNLTLAAIQARSAVLQRAVLILAGVLWLLLLLERFGAAGLHAFATPNADAWRALAAQAVAAVPDVLYLLALDGVRRALGEFARGDLFAPTITRMLDRVGILLAGGALFGVFLVPALQRALGAGPGYWIAFDVSGLVLGALGLMLTVLARVVGHAASVKAELDGIF